MKYLLDTDISSFYLRGRYNLLDVFIRKGIDNIRIPRPTVAQLEVAAYRNRYKEINFSNIQSFSQNFGILEVDNETWQIFPKLRAETLKQGKTRGDFDILIASIATQHDLIVVTNNEKHFKDLVGIENWIKIN